MNVPDLAHDVLMPVQELVLPDNAVTLDEVTVKQRERQGVLTVDLIGVIGADNAAHDAYLCAPALKDDKPHQMYLSLYLRVPLAPSTFT